VPGRKGSNGRHVAGFVDGVRRGGWARPERSPGASNDAIGFIGGFPKVRFGAALSSTAAHRANTESDVVAATGELGAIASVAGARRRLAACLGVRYATMPQQVEINRSPNQTLRALGRKLALSIVAAVLVAAVGYLGHSGWAQREAAALAPRRAEYDRCLEAGPFPDVPADRVVVIGNGKRLIVAQAEVPELRKAGYRLASPSDDLTARCGLPPQVRSNPFEVLPVWAGNVLVVSMVLIAISWLRWILPDIKAAAIRP
jgi:hypothetical protein